MISPPQDSTLLESKVDSIDKKLDTLALTTQKDVAGMLGHKENPLIYLLCVN
ncbi:hypothetical protein Ga0466249_001406 [Sporomusaceae bacterium BoRhaA]|nr:hypothetical protein [Pelorhabdus rhamnosifermentans]